MKKKIILKMLLSFSACIFLSCEDLTEIEFKQKYDWAEAICTTGNRNAIKGSSRYYTFTYQGKIYDVIYDGFSNVRNGYQCYILFDKNNPDKHYMVLFNRPIYPEVEMIYTYVGKVSEINKYNNNCLSVRYKFYVTSKGEEHLVKYSEALPLEYYDLLKKLEKTQEDILIDCYVTKVRSDGEGELLPFINRADLDLKRAAREAGCLQ